jgi:hypothetical protein
MQWIMIVMVSITLCINNRPNILCVKHTFLLEINLGIGVRSPEGSFNFSCFCSEHTVPKTVLINYIFISQLSHNVNVTVTTTQFILI